jgi:hypothetical protein
MKLKLSKPFGFMVGTVEVKYPLGVLRVPEDISEEAARDAVRMGAGAWVPEKVAPENKLAVVPETKAPVVKVRRRSKRAKPDA